MRKWLFKLLANGNSVIVNTEFFAETIFVEVPRGRKFIAVNAWLNGARLERAGKLMERYAPVA